MTLGITAYINRTIDLAAYQNAPTQGTALLTAALALDGTSGTVLTGIEKLAQRFLLELLTETGSIAYSTRGCNFMTDARMSLWRTSTDVEQSFYTALVAITANLQLEESTTDPDDERFATASALSVILDSDSVAIQVQVTSLAGTSRVVIAPLPLTV